jgi:hypothetical protein
VAVVVVVVLVPISYPTKRRSTLLSSSSEMCDDDISKDMLNSSKSARSRTSTPLPIHDPSSSLSSSRRLSLESLPPMTSTNEDTSSPSSQQSAFYLKHQNRALATELKSHQYFISELEQERTVRRSHCLTIFQTVQQLLHIWNTIENTLVSVKVDDTNPNGNDMDVDAATISSIRKVQNLTKLILLRHPDRTIQSNGPVYCILHLIN